MVPEQTLEVQKADEAGKRRVGKQRPCKWQGPVGIIPASSSGLEHLICGQDFHRDPGKLHPQLHVLVPSSAPGIYATTSTDVK